MVDINTLIKSFEKELGVKNLNFQAQITKVSRIPCMCEIQLNDSPFRMVDSQSQTLQGAI
jgi:hypothetical protein